MKYSLVKNDIRVNNEGFTLLEILLAVGIVGMLASIALVSINPNRQFKIARDTQRVSNVNTIANAISQNMSENGGVISCNGVVKDLPSAPTELKSGGELDLADCLVPDYISSLPFDPKISGKHYIGPNDYETGYKVYLNAEERIVVEATPEMAGAISAIR